MMALRNRGILFEVRMDVFFSLSTYNVNVTIDVVVLDSRDVLKSKNENHHVYMYQDTHLILHTSLVQYVVTLTLTSTCSFEKGTSPNSLFVRCGCSLCFSCAISGFQFILYLYLNYTPKHIPSHIYSTVLVIELLGPQLSYTNVNPKLKQYSVIL